MDDTAANVVRARSSTGLLVMYVSKTVSTADKGRFQAFGREFSGTIATGQKVRTHRQHYKPGGEDDLNVRNIQQTALMMEQATEQIADGLAKHGCAYRCRPVPSEVWHLDDH